MSVPRAQRGQIRYPKDAFWSYSTSCDKLPRHLTTTQFFIYFVLLDFGRNEKPDLVALPLASLPTDGLSQTVIILAGRCPSNPLYISL